MSYIALQGVTSLIACNYVDFNKVVFIEGYLLSFQWSITPIGLINICKDINVLGYSMIYMIYMYVNTHCQNQWSESVQILLSIPNHRFLSHTHHSFKASSQYLMCLVEYLPGKSCSFVAKLYFPLVFKEMLEPYQIKLDEGLWQVYKSFSKEKNYHYVSLWLHWRVTCGRGFACLLLLPIFVLIIDTGQWSPESLVADCEWK